MEHTEKTLYPLTQAQQRIWYTEMLNPNTASCLLSGTIKFTVPINLYLLQHVIETVIKRHTAFRIKLMTEREETKQYIGPLTYNTIVHVEIPEENYEQYVDSWLDIHNREPLKLYDSDLYQFIIFKIKDKCFGYNIKIHHIISDGISLANLVNEITKTYTDIKEGQFPPSSNAGSYIDYIFTEKNYEQSERYQKDKAFWLEQFQTLPVLTELKPHNSLLTSTKGERKYFDIDAELYQRIKLFSDQYKISMFTFFLSAFYVYMNKMTHESDMVVGTNYVNRSTREEKETLGMYVSTTAVRIFVDPQEEVLSFLQKVSKLQSKILRHQKYPYNQLIKDIRELHTAQDIQRLFGTAMEYRPLTVQEIDGAPLIAYTNFCGDEVNDLLIHVVEKIDKHAMEIYVDYRTELFNGEEISSIMSYLLNIARGMSGSPNCTIAELSMMNEDEVKATLYDWNDTAADYPRGQTVEQLFEQQVGRTPEQTAVICEDRRLTYRELNAQANRLAHSLRAAGVQADHRVAICAKHSAEVVIAILAVLKAGGAYVPMDPASPDERIAYMLQDSGARIALVGDGVQLPADYNGRVLPLGANGAPGGTATPVEELDAPRDRMQHLAYMIYTSGSTGQPKGVLIEHQGLTNYIWWSSRTYVQGMKTTFPLYSSLAFDLTVTSIFTPLITGNTVIVYPGDDKAALLPRIFRDPRIDLIKLTPAHLHLVHELGLVQDSTIRRMIVGGENLSAKLAAGIWEQSGGTVRLFNEYGPTETVVGCMSYLYDPARPMGEYVPIGRPAANTSIYVLDPYGQPVPAGVAGEMYIGGDGVARGYLNRAEQTAEKFVANPFVPGQRMYRAGDVARRRIDGELEYIGRTDDQVKIRGYRIELGEVEGAIRALTGVREVVVIARSAESGWQELCAYVVTDGNMTGRELRAALSASLPEYMIPTYFVPLEALPLTSNGKMDRKALPAPQAYVEPGVAYAPPRNAVEEHLVSIWAAVLGVAQVGIYDSFLDLGGDSIKSIQVSAKLFQAGYQVGMKELLTNPTIAALSSHVEPVKRTAEQGEIRGVTGMTPIQQAFVIEQATDLHHYNQCVVLQRPDGWEVRALQAAMQAITDHHDALRTVLRRSDSGYTAWTRQIGEGAGYSLEVLDMAPDTDSEEAIAAEASRIQATMDLSEGPLVKLGLFRCTDGDHLLVAIHHWVIDGVSWRILLEDLGTAYTQAQQGEPIRLPMKTDAFQAWAEGLSHYARSEALQAEAGYWAGIQATAAPGLPQDYAETGVSLVKDSEEVTVQWTAGETEQLLKQSHRAYTTEMNDLLLTALGRAIQAWTGITEVALSLEGHGREAIVPELDVTRTVGWFTSRYPVRLSFPAGQALSVQIKTVKEELRRVPNKGIGYGLLRYTSDQTEDGPAGQTPEISFNYLGQFDTETGYEGMQVAAFMGGLSVSPNQSRLYALDINGIVAQGQLSFSISYSAKQFEKQSIQKLAWLLHDKIIEIMEHCVSQEQVQLTPSDVSMKGLSVGELDELLEQLQHACEHPQEVENIYSLTPMQKGMLFHGVADRQSSAYVEQILFKLHGQLNVDHFANALEKVMQRHSVFRTFFMDNWRNAPLQIVYRNARLSFVYEDMGALNEQQYKEHVRLCALQEKELGFDLARGPLMRMTILGTKDHQYQCIWTFHHIILDGWCLPLFFGELMEHYDAALQQRQAELPAVAPYSQYIEWLEAQNHEEASAYWQAYLDGYEGQANVPAATLLQKANDSYVCEEHTCLIDGELTRYMKMAAADVQVTVNTFIQTVWGTLLQKHNDSDDVVFGSVVSGRPAELEGVSTMVGPCINTIPVRIRTTADMSFAELLQMSQRQAISSIAYDTYPLYEMQRESGRKQELITHILVFENYPVDAQMHKLVQGGHKSGLTIANVEIREQTNYDFNLIVLPGETFTFKFQYNASIYSQADIEQISNQLLHLLRQIAERPHMRVNELQWVTEADKRLILDVFNDTAQAYPHEQPIAQLFEEQAARVPEQIAVVCGDKSWTYRALQKRSNQLAHTLRACGVQPDQRIGILADRSADMIVGMLAILKAGGAYLPINPTYPSERIRFMLADGQVSVLLTASAGTGDAVHQAMERVKQAGYEGRMLDLGDENAYAADDSDLPSVSGAHHLAYVMYTSGSTGQPKGVMVEQRSVVRLVKETNVVAWTPADRILLTGALVFDACTFEIWGALLNGLRLVIVPEMVLLSAELLGEAIREHQITVMWLTAPLFHQLAQQEPAQFEPLRYLIVGGDALVPSVVSAVRRACPNVTLVNGYGPTENTTFSCSFEVDQDYTNNIPIGRPIANSTAYIMDQEGRLLPIGMAGEIWVGGAGLARGYLNQEELTRERFVPHPWAAGERLYRTGDRGRWRPDGTISYLGRMDQQVKIRGYRIEPGEIEAKLQSLPFVQQAAVVVHEAEDGAKQLAAYYVAEREMTGTRIREALLEELPAYMIPAYMIPLERLPLTPNGKVDRKELPVPTASIQTGVEYTAPGNEVEQVLVTVWQKVLGVPQIGTGDNFFDLGGDSIKAIQVSSGLRQAGYHLEMKHLFSYPTIASLNSHVHILNRVADQKTVIGKVKRSPIQYWFLENQIADPHHMNQSMLLFREQRFDEQTLRHSMQGVITHHDALRMVFRQTEYGYEAWNRGMDDGELYHLEIVDFTADSQPFAAIEAAANRIQQSIDLEKGPLVKLGLFRCADGDHLLIVIHHLVVDGVSWRILLEDIARAYEQVEAGAFVQLPVKTDSFQTWAHKLSDHATSNAIEQERSFWEAVDHTIVSPLPVDLEVSRSLIKDSETITLQWSEEETGQLLKGANRAYNTEINDLLLTALGIAVHRWTGMEKVAIMLEGHGRESIMDDVDISRTVGWFTSLYPVILSVRHHTSIASRIKGIKEGLREIPNKGIGYGLLRYLSENHGARNATFGDLQPEVSFNYLGQFDQDLENSSMRLSTYSVGSEVSGNQLRPYKLIINGSITNGNLSLQLSYSKKQYLSQTMQQFAAYLEDSLRQVIEHCASCERTEITPSDLSLKHLTMEELEQIIQQTQHIGDIEDVYPLTPLQKGMLFHNLLDSRSGVYFEQITFEMQGNLKLDVFGQSLEELTKAHAILRTRFDGAWKDYPLQIVYKNPQVELYAEDIRELEEVQQQQRLHSYAETDQQRGFNLSQDILMRMAVFRIADETYSFIWSFHHILMDGWCVPLVTSELFEYYSAFLINRQPNVQQSAPYSKYMEWLAAQDDEQAAHYWEQYLSGYEEHTAIPGEREGDSDQKYIRQEVALELDNDSIRQLKQIAAIHQVTLNSVLQTVWGLWLQMANASQDVVFGTVVSGRPSDLAGAGQMIGLFINTIPVRIQCHSTDSLSEIMIRTQSNSVASAAYDTYPLYEVQAHTHQKQDLITHLLVFENYPVEEQMQQLIQGEHTTGLTIADAEIREQTNYDFNLIVLPGETFTFKFQYNASVYSQADIEQISNQLLHLLRQIAERPHMRVNELQWVTEANKRLILDVFNDTAQAYPHEQPIAQLFEEQAARVPEQIAVVCGDKSWTYRALQKRSNQLAHTLRACGVQPDQRIGILADRSADMIVGMLAILKAGGAYLPINPTYPSERIRFMLADGQVNVLLTASAGTGDAVHQAMERVKQAGYEGRMLDLGDENAYAADDSDLPSVSGAHHLAYVMYTSGSTGQPKGVMVEQRSVVRLVKGTNVVAWTPADRILLTGALVFDACTFEIWGALLNGLRLVIVPEMVLLSAELLGEAIREHQITVMWLTAPLFHQLVQQEPAQFEPLRYLIVGGDALVPSVVSAVRRACPNVTLVNGYGPTENTTFSCSFEIDQDYTNNIPIGRPIANSTAYIMDQEGRLLPIGMAGEIWVGGAGLARGYLNQEELTRERFVAHPWAAGERLYRTGDRGRWRPDGTISYLGRMDQQVKIRGYRIEPGEIEAKLQSLPFVQQAAVVVHEAEDGAKQLAAYYVAEREMTGTRIREALLEELPAYMIPAYMIPLERLPLTPNGKVDRKELPVPTASIQTGVEYTAPGNEVEQVLVTVWQKVLGVPQIGTGDNFFDLGGDSIKAIQVSSRLIQAGYKIGMKDLFKYPSIAALSPYTERVTRIPEQGEISGKVELTPIQRWLFTQETGNEAHFNQSFFLHRPSGFKEEALRQVMDSIITHHDALRTVYRRTDSGYEAWNRGISEGELYDLEVMDFAASNPTEVMAEIEEAANRIQRSIDLEKGPLVKLGLFRCPDGDHLLIVIHHLVVDGVSWRILLEDLANAFGQAESGKDIKLPSKTDAYQVWANQLVQYANSTSIEQELQYWRRVKDFETAPLPRDYDETGQGTIGDSELLTLRFTKMETEQLLKQTNRAYRTEINDLLLTALGTAIHGWTGSENIFVNLEGHGREHMLPDCDISRTVGWFTSQYPVLLHIPTDADTGLRIKTVKEALREIPQKGVGFSLLRHLSHHGEEMGKLVEPEICFNYLGQFDQDLSNSGMSISHYSGGSDVSQGGRRPYVLEFHGMITDGCLNLAISYNRKQYRQKTVEHLAEKLQCSLREIINHCMSKKQMELTPSDILCKGISIPEMEQIILHMGQDRAIENIYPLTPVQKGMLFHSLLDPQSAAYFEQTTFDMEGVLNEAAFAQALDQLTHRHAILRTGFYTGWKDTPLQVVYQDSRIDFRTEDVRGIRESEREQWLTAYADQDKAKGFNLQQDVLMRLSVLRTGQRSYRLVWSFHHILMDGWCVPLVAQELFELYEAIRNERQPRLQDAPLYSDYIEWLESRPVEEAASYWSNYLAGYEEQTILPGKLVQAAEFEGYESGRVIRRFGHSLTYSLKQAANSNRVTVHTFMQAVWGILLQKYNNHMDVVFGTVVSGRPPVITGIESMVGLFINTIPVRVHCDADDSFADLALRMQQQALAAHEFDTYSLMEIQARTPQKHQLLSHIMVFENYPLEQQLTSMDEDDGQSLLISNAHVTEQTHYDFNVIVLPGEDITVHFEFNTNAYDTSIIEQVAGRFLQMLEQAAAKPDMGVHELDWLTKEEKRDILEVFNDTEADYPREQTVEQLFEQQVGRTPEQTAVICEDRRLTYRELNAQANRLAHSLRAAGVQADHRVAICAEHSAEVVIAILAVLKAGGAYVPMDPASPDERIAYMLQDSGARIALVGDGVQLPADYNGRVLPLGANGAPGGTATPVEELDAPRDRMQHLAYMIYTSGSTGQPKGVLIEHQGLTNYIWWSSRTYVQGMKTTFPLYSSLAFDLTVTSIFTPLITGNTVIVYPGDDKAALLPRIFRDPRIDLIKLTPAHLHLVHELGLVQDSTIRRMIVGGENLSAKLAAGIWEQSGGTVRLFNEYGPTETVVGCMSYLYDPARPMGEYVPIGRPAANTSIYVLDPYGQPVPAGVAGEMYIGGDGVARGYLNRAEQTAEKFVANPFVPGQRMYRAGDVARRRIDGELEYIGRTDDQVKIRGYRIELGEVEGAIRALTAVREVVVIARSAESGWQELCAYVVTDGNMTGRELRAALSASLPEYMIPTYFVPLEALPLTSNGKMDRKALPAPQAYLESGAAYAPPRNAVEEHLVSIWAEILDVERIGITDSFFDKGGHSLKATTLVSRIQKQMDASISLKDIFRFPTIERLSELITGLDSHTYYSISVAAEQAYYPVSSAQRRLFLAGQAEGAQLTYNMPGVLIVTGSLDVHRLEQAFQQLIGRHESLRTGFELAAGEPAQFIYPNAPFEVELLHATEDQIDSCICEFVRVFDLQRPPLLRVGIIQTDAERHILLFDMHHLVSDGVSMNILVQEFIRLYGGETLPPLRIQYKDYAVWQQAQIADGAYKRHEDYWLEMFKGDLPQLELPTDYERPTVRSYEGDVHHFVIEKSLAQELQQLAVSTDATLFMVFMAAYTVLLAKYSGQDDMIIGTSVAGRTHADMEPLIGMFVNTLAVRHQPFAGKTFSSYVQDVKQTMLNAYEHQDYPFEEILKHLQLQRDPGRNPLFDTMLVYQNMGEIAVEMDSLVFSSYEQSRKSAKFDLTLYVQPEGEQLRCEFEFSRYLFETETIHVLATDLLSVLSEVVQQPEIPIQDIKLIEKRVPDESVIRSIELSF